MKSAENTIFIFRKPIKFLPEIGVKAEDLSMWRRHGQTERLSVFNRYHIRAEGENKSYESKSEKKDWERVWRRA